MSSNAKSVFSGSVWGIIAKVLDAIAKFITIPMLVGLYGKADYGLIALSFSLNAYMQLMDLGFNLGSIRFFSRWISDVNWVQIEKVSRSSTIFYGVIGILNAILFLVLAQYADHFFKLTPSQIPIFRWMLIILASGSIFNWVSNVISQLLTANGQLGWVNRVTIISSLFNFITAYCAVVFKLSISVYFLLYTLSTILVIPLNLWKLKIGEMAWWQLLSPKWDKIAFNEILGYSLSIFAIGIFQFSADNLRPLFLGRYSSQGISVLTDYRVIQTMAMLVIAFGGVFLQALLPSAARLKVGEDHEKIRNMVFNGTKYISIFLSFIVFILILNADILLKLYMGQGYTSLALCLILWLLTVLLQKHNAPVASMLLSSGKTKLLAYVSAISCIISLPITIILAPTYNVGAAVIGYLVYSMLEISFFYFYYIPFVLKLNSFELFFKSFMLSVVSGALAAFITYYFSGFLLESKIITLLINSALFSIVYAIIVFFVIMGKRDTQLIMQKIR